MSEKQKQFGELADKLIKFINENYHPHTTIIIDNESAEVLEGSMGYHNNKHIKD